jgi:hypothetical protein
VDFWHALRHRHVRPSTVLDASSSNAWPGNYAYENVESKEVKWEEIQMKRILAVLAVVAMAAAIPMVSSAKPTECNGTITGVHGSLTVSDNDNCDLEGATIHGDIDVTGGSLLVNSQSRIDGGIDMTDGSLTVCDSRIDGGIDVTGGNFVGVGGDENDGFLSGVCPSNLINGHTTVSGVHCGCVATNVKGLQCNSVSAEPPGPDCVEFEANIIHGGLVLNNNNGQVEVEGNIIHGDLSCSGNIPLPTDNGNPNSVTSGHKIDQCHDL